MKNIFCIRFFQLVFLLCCFVGINGCYPDFPPQGCEYSKDPDCNYEYEDPYYRGYKNYERKGQSHSRKRYSDEAIDYFMEIAFGSEYLSWLSGFNVQKWQGDVRIKLYEGYNSEDKREVEKIAEELSDLTGLNIEINDSRPNLKIYFVDPDKIKRDFPLIYRFIPKPVPVGLFMPFKDSDYVIYKAMVFIDQKLKGEERKSVLREEITQSLGIAKDSYSYPDSIFHQESSPTRFADIDEEVIQILYDNRIRPGMTKLKAKRALE